MKLKRNTRKTKYGSGENETGPGECASYAISIRGFAQRIAGTTEKKGNKENEMKGKKGKGNEAPAH